MQRLLGWACLLLLTACTGMSPKAPEEALAAERAFAAGDFAAAAEAFVDAAAVSRGRADHYLLRAAEARRENADWDQAEALAARVQSRRLEPREQERLALLQAELALRHKDPERALGWLDSLGSAGLQDSSLRPRYLDLRARALQRREPLAAARAYAELAGLLRGRERSEAQRKVRSLLAGLKDQSLRDLAATMRIDDPLRAALVRALSSRGYSVPPHLRDTGSASGISGGAPQRVAVLLPMQGPLAPAASAIRDGLLAARMGDRSHQAELRFVDSGGSPETALAAYRQAVIDGADMVIGPLDRGAVQALFAEDDLPVPVLALNRTEFTPAGQTSFALSPEDEGAALGTRLQRRDRLRIVTVGTADDASQRALAAMRARLELGGGSVLADIRVDDRQVDYQQAIRAALVGAGLPTSRPEDLNEPHDPGFDAVVLALRAPTARLAVPQLKLFGLSEVPMLSTSLIYAQGGNAQLDRDLSGVEFCDAPWLLDDLPGLPERAAMARNLDSAQGGSARLFAFGIDAWLLARARRVAGEERSFQGASGMLSVDDSGEVQREPAFAVFRSGRPQRLSEGSLITDGGPQG
ncbi:MAG: penicillin-binding protein activator [Xanthomonadales bacterium]|nr:penicillin-binding protein activator [Xanthomonadales bacterium]